MSAGTRALTSAKQKVENAKQAWKRAKTTRERMTALALYRREMFTLVAIREKLEKLEREARNVNGKNHG